MSDLQIKVIQQGAGGSKPKQGNIVTVHYDGRLLDGTTFDSSRRRGKPFQFQLGMGKVIKGWDLGVARMSKGEKAQITIPPHLGYGMAGAGGVIPPNATLIFDIELLDFR